MRSYWVYILASKKNGTLYIGVTNDIKRRVFEHKEKIISGFSQKYNVIHLVYAEEYKEISDAIHREKCIKRWKRNWKIRLIEGNNPNWNDLFDNIL